MSQKNSINYDLLARREYVQIFADMREAVRELDRATQAEIYFSVVEYGFTGKIPDRLSPVAAAMVKSMETRLKTSLTRAIAALGRGERKQDAND